MSSRRTQLGVISALAALIVVIAIVVSQSGSDSGEGGVSDEETASVEQRFKGIPQRGAALGDQAAPEKVIEFVDMQCPFCAEFTRNALPEIVSGQVREGDLALGLRVISILGPDSETAARAAAAAQLQNRLWQFADLFYLNQGTENSGYVTDSFIEDLYQATPDLDVGQALVDRDSAGVAQLLSRNQALAAQLRVDSTPSLFLVRRGGPPQPLALDAYTAGAFERALATAGG